MTQLDEIKQFVLDNDAVEGRTWQAWTNGAQIVQSNGTNPRIRQLGLRDAGEFALQMDRVMGQLYEVRIVKDDDIAPLVRADAKWQLSFDEGTTFVDCRVLPPIRESTQQGLAWLVTLERQQGV